MQNKNDKVSVNTDLEEDDGAASAGRNATPNKYYFTRQTGRITTRASIHLPDRDFMIWQKQNSETNHSASGGQVSWVWKPPGTMAIPGAPDRIQRSVQRRRWRTDGQDHHRVIDDLPIQQPMRAI